MKSDSAAPTVVVVGSVNMDLVAHAPRLPADGAWAGAPGRLGFFKLVPWFIIGFLVLAALRSFQLVPDIAIAPVTKTAAILTVVSMAALGLGVDVRVIGRVGGRVTAAVTLSLVLLLLISLGLIHLLRLG